MESTKKRKPEGGPEASKSLRKKLVRSLRGKPKFLECIGEPMKVYLRVRPFTDAEMSSGESQACLEIENFTSVLMHPPKDSFTFKHQTRNGSNAETVHRFSFSHVFGPETNQRSFFEDTSLNVVKDFIDGQNCLVFSYGVTNAGKVSCCVVICTTANVFCIFMVNNTCLILSRRRTPFMDLPRIWEFSRGH